MSVGFLAQKTAWVKDEGDQRSHRRIERIKLFEVSVVPIACNQQAEVTDVKSGRAISKDNESLIQQAVECLQEVLKDVGSDDDSDESDETDEKAHALAERKSEIEEIAEYLGGAVTD